MRFVLYKMHFPSGIWFLQNRKRQGVTLWSDELGKHVRTWKTQKGAERAARIRRLLVLKVML